MIKHVLKSGKRVSSITGYVISKQQASGINALIDQITQRGANNGKRSQTDGIKAWEVEA